MISQEVYTKIFLAQNDQAVDEVNIKLYSKKWWYPGRSGNLNLRLTKEGFDMLTNTLNITSYQIDFLEPIALHPKTLIFLGKYMECPYYIGSHTLMFVFSEHIAAELYLFCNDIERYGLIKAIENREK